MAVHKKTKLSDTIIFGILEHFRQLRHFPDLFELW